MGLHVSECQYPITTLQDHLRTEAIEDAWHYLNLDDTMDDSDLELNLDLDSELNDKDMEWNGSGRATTPVAIGVGG